MKRIILKKVTKLSLGIVFWVCMFATTSYAESDIKLWKSQTVYVPIYSQIFSSGDDKRQLDLSANLSIRNTDSINSIHITEVNYYDSQGKLIKSHLNSPKELKPMSSIYFLVRRLDTSGGWGANFIVKWESAKSITEPLIEAIHMGAAGPNSYAFDSRGKAIKGIHE